jgi:K+-transporting ATPase ATPase C chain
MLKQLIPGLRVTFFVTLLTGLIYPVLVTVLCQWFFPKQANGSLAVSDGRIVGSTLIGQTFTRPEYFHARPSAAGSDGYDAAASSGSNYGPTNKKLIDRVKLAVEDFRNDNPDFAGPMPSDLVTASASGLDPHISPDSALAQAARVAKARGASRDQIGQLIAQFTENRDLGFLGEPRVNVLKLNLALDRQFGSAGGPAAALH